MLNSSRMKYFPFTEFHGYKVCYIAFIFFLVMDLSSPHVIWMLPLCGSTVRKCRNQVLHLRNLWRLSGMLSCTDRNAGIDACILQHESGIPRLGLYANYVLFHILFLDASMAVLIENGPPYLNPNNDTRLMQSHCCLQIHISDQARAHGSAARAAAQGPKNFGAPKYWSFSLYIINTKAKRKKKNSPVGFHRKNVCWFTSRF
jgi:hypothetical protein